MRTFSFAGVVALAFWVAGCLSQPCPFMGDGRQAKPITNLGNCTWYEDSACCERAEVSSVFAEMLRLQNATTACRNHMNYLMCYFCSPDQHRFITVEGDTQKTHICRDFCTDLLEHCKYARYQGRPLHEAYTSGEAFCAANAFHVSTRECLSFNASVFPPLPTSKANFNFHTNIKALVFLLLGSVLALCSL